MDRFLRAIASTVRAISIAPPATTSSFAKSTKSTSWSLTARIRQRLSIWAEAFRMVPSMPGSGISPATGRTIFYSRPATTSHRGQQSDHADPNARFNLAGLPTLSESTILPGIMRPTSYSAGTPGDIARWQIANNQLVPGGAQTIGTTSPLYHVVGTATSMAMVQTTSCFEMTKVMSPFGC